MVKKIAMNLVPLVILFTTSCFMAGGFSIIVSPRFDPTALIFIQEYPGQNDRVYHDIRDRLRHGLMARGFNVTAQRENAYILEFEYTLMLDMLGNTKIDSCNIFIKDSYNGDVLVSARKHGFSELPFEVVDNFLTELVKKVRSR